MNNKINIEVNELVKSIVELCERKGNATYAHSYALGTLQSVIHSVQAGYVMSLQEALNDSYRNVKGELDAFNKGVHAYQS
jgi:hypothetical protein